MVTFETRVEWPWCHLEFGCARHVDELGEIFEEELLQGLRLLG